MLRSSAVPLDRITMDTTASLPPMTASPPMTAAPRAQEAGAEEFAALLLRACQAVGPAAEPGGVDSPAASLPAGTLPVSRMPGPGVPRLTLPMPAGAPAPMGRVSPTPNPAPIRGAAPALSQPVAEEKEAALTEAEPATDPVMPMPVLQEQAPGPAPLPSFEAPVEGPSPAEGPDTPRNDMPEPRFWRSKAEHLPEAGPTSLPMPGPLPAAGPSLSPPASGPERHGPPLANSAAQALLPPTAAAAMTSVAPGTVSPPVPLTSALPPAVPTVAGPDSARPVSNSGRPVLSGSATSHPARERPMAIAATFGQAMAQDRLAADAASGTEALPDTPAPTYVERPVDPAPVPAGPRPVEFPPVRPAMSEVLPPAGFSPPQTTPPAAADTPAPAMPAVGPSSAPPPPPARQVAQVTIALALGQGQAPRLTVALEPESLGRVEIRIERGAEGEASAVQVLAERPETLALLQRDARELDRALGQAGVTIADGALQFGLSGGQPEQRPGQQPGRRGPETGQRAGQGSLGTSLESPGALRPATGLALTLLDIAV